MSERRPLACGRWWLRVFGYGIRLIDHRRHLLLFSERQRVDGAPYFHVGPWCIHPLRPWRSS